MRQRSVRKWMVVNEEGKYYSKNRSGFVGDFIAATYYEKVEHAEELLNRKWFDQPLKIVRVRVILQHLEEYKK